MIKHLIEQRSEAWFDLRAGRITGTRFASLMAKKTTAAYQNLVADVVSELITGDIEGSDYISQDMQHGIDTEPEAREVYEALYNCNVEEVGFVTPDEEHQFYDVVGVSPDGLTDKNGLLEIKCPKRSTHLYYIKSNKLPSKYKYQVYGQLYVSDLDYCDFMSYVPGLKPFIIRVYPDKDIFEAIENELNIFVDEVKKLKVIYEQYKWQS